MALESKITTADIVRNVGGVYDGDLIEYFRIVTVAPSVNNPYHGIRHTLHVMWLCHNACEFYGAGPRGFADAKLNQRQARILLIAALFHDYGHSGTKQSDHLEIETAVQGFRKHVLPGDLTLADEVECLIRSTEYPHRPDGGDELSHKILRDADLCQALDRVWIQNVVFGLGSEWNISSLEMLNKQVEFLRTLQFETTWAMTRFSKQDIESKIKETEDLIRLLE